MKRSPLLPIFLVVLVDVLGFTIVYPLLPFYALEFGATPLIATTLVSVYAFGSLLSTPVIGRLSDQFGRRRLLLISQAGTCLGFIVLALASSLWMLFLGRILDGLTAGNLSIAQAYISDHTEPRDRAKAFGVIGIAFGIGFSLGPAMAGLLGGPDRLHVPFVVAACLSAGSMVLTWVLLEPGVPKPHSDPDAGDVAKSSSQAALPNARAAAPGGKRPGLFDLATYLDFFRRPVLGSVYLQFFCFTFAFSAFMGGFALFAKPQLGWTQREVGYLFAYSGLLGIILQGGLLGRLVKRFGEPGLVITGFISVVVAYVTLGFAVTVAIMVIAATMSTLGNGVLRPVITSQITQHVGRYEQGVAIGISGSLSSLALTIAPPIGGFLLDHHMLVGWTLVPAVAAAVGLIAALHGRQAAATRAGPLGDDGGNADASSRPDGSAPSVDSP